MGSSVNNSSYSGMLSDIDIRKYWKKGINITSSGIDDLPFDLEKQLQLGSIDLRFSHEYQRIKVAPGQVLNYSMLKSHSYIQPDHISNGYTVEIQPGEMLQTTTLETVSLSDEFAGIITGRSSFARLGIMIHCCQEFVNPGHGQTIPLQIINMAPCPVELDLRVPICQLILFKLVTPASGRYKTAIGSKYANENSPLPSQIYLESAEHQKPEPGNDKKVRNIIKRFRSLLNRYILPFLPTLIMAMLVTPFIQNNINNKTISEFIDIVLNMPLPIVIGTILVIIYAWLKRGEK